MPEVRAYGHVISKFSRMDRLLHFLTHGAPLILEVEYFIKSMIYQMLKFLKIQKIQVLLILNFLKQKKLIFNFVVNRN